MEKVHEAREIETAGYARGVWLVKVPKYLATKWRNAGSGKEVGKLKIAKTRHASGKTDTNITFSLDDELAKHEATDLVKSEVPKDHTFKLSGAGGQSLCVFSSEQDRDAESFMDANPEKVIIEGKVSQRAECRPPESKNYIDLKRKIGQNMTQPQRQVVQLDKIVQNYKPKAYHVHNLQAEKTKKEETKRSRMDAEKVQELLFSAFEKHQYYNVKDLVKITQQPITYLKEILKEVCVYNMKAPHRNMWELKPEYRHYKDD